MSERLCAEPGCGKPLSAPEHLWGVAWTSKHEFKPADQAPSEPQRGWCPECEVVVDEEHMKRHASEPKVDPRMKKWRTLYEKIPAERRANIEAQVVKDIAELESQRKMPTMEELGLTSVSPLWGSVRITDWDEATPKPVATSDLFAGQAIIGRLMPGGKRQAPGPSKPVAAADVEKELLEELGFPDRPIKLEGVILEAVWLLLLRTRRENSSLADTIYKWEHAVAREPVAAAQALVQAEKTLNHIRNEYLRTVPQSQNDLRRTFLWWRDQAIRLQDENDKLRAEPANAPGAGHEHKWQQHIYSQCTECGVMFGKEEKS